MELVGCKRANRDRMHGMRDQVADAVEHGAMPREPGEPEELLGHDRDRKVPAARRGAGMPGVLGAVVGDFEARSAQSAPSRASSVAAAFTASARKRSAPARRPAPARTAKTARYRPIL